MEKSVEKFPKKPNKEGDVLKIHDGNNYNFNDVAEYLLNHHRIKYQKVKKIDAKYLWMAMLVIALTISIRGIFILIGSHG